MALALDGNGVMSAAAARSDTPALISEDRSARAIEALPDASAAGAPDVVA